VRERDGEKRARRERGAVIRRGSAVTEVTTSWYSGSNQSVLATAITPHSVEASKSDKMSISGNETTSGCLQIRYRPILTFARSVRPKTVVTQSNTNHAAKALKAALTEEHRPNTLEVSNLVLILEALVRGQELRPALILDDP
jgi:hypothetical protein